MVDAIPPSLHFGRYSVPSLLMLLLLLASGCSGSGGGGGESKGPPKGGPVLVMTAKTVRKTMPMRVPAHGHLEACAKVEIKSRVDGEILKIPFREGAAVASGDLLFEIDNRSFANQLALLKANLKRDQAQLELTRSQEKRRRELLHSKAASDDQYDTSKAALIAAEATVLADEAAIRNMELNLEYTRIRAPMAGRVGRQFFKVGNLVKANDANPLVVIHQMDPLCLGFAVPERHLPVILTHQAKKPLPVSFTVPDESGSGSKGTLTWIDNGVDRATGTIPLQAGIPNPDNRFWPGQFVQVQLHLYDQENMVVVPTPSLLSGPKGRFVFVVKGEKEKTASVRPVTVEREDEKEAVIKEGIDGNEEVVISGQWRLANGAKVEINNATAKAGP
ncbi:MAG: efflux RND transporter periplasmic adaptor subunit [Magnetococcales bacterium]|nr:efflux RND transporter periplasmic adaptor subunit [Magnetococcales bacterium]